MERRRCLCKVISDGKDGGRDRVVMDLLDETKCNSLSLSKGQEGVTSRRNT